MPYIVEDKVKFLLEAGRILSSTLDYNVTLVSVSKLIVNNIADFCIIDILEDDGSINRVDVRTYKKSEQVVANKMYKFLPNPKNKRAIYEAAHTGSSILVKNVTKEWIKGVSTTKEEKEVTEKLNLSSLIFAPLISRGKVRGVLSVGSTDKNFSYTEEDELFLNTLAVRAALAVDNARLFSEAQEALRSRDEFLAIASHELKTPLTSILLALQYSLRHLNQNEDKDIAKVKNALETGITQTRRLSALMNDLLNISVISTGNLKIEKEEADLVQIIKDAISGVQLQIERKHIKINFKSNKQIVIGNWDKVRLGEVFSNLISNAIKYGKNKPINISLKAEKKYIIIKVVDRGIGISNDDMKNVFEIFRRTSASKDYKGIGVGLYISKEIIAAHNGEIILESKPDKGSKFTLKLPR